MGEALNKFVLLCRLFGMLMGGGGALLKGRLYYPLDEWVSYESYTQDESYS